MPHTVRHFKFGYMALVAGLTACIAFLPRIDTYAASSQEDAVQNTLEEIYHAQTFQSWGAAIERLPFGPPGRSDEDVRLNYYQPWIPFDTSRSKLRGQYSLIPVAVKLLRSETPQPKDGVERQTIERQTQEQDTVLAASILATIGGERTVTEALPALVLATAARGGEKDNFVTRWQLMNCMVTLCGAKNVVTDIALLLKSHPDPKVRSAAAATLGLNGQLIGNTHMERTPDGKSRQLPAQAALQNDLRNTVPVLAKVAAEDAVPDVRLTALNALHNGMYGTRAENWEPALPDLARVLGKRDVPTEEHRAALRVLAEIPTNPRPAMNAFRPYLTSADSLSRGYALVTLGHVAKSGDQRSVTRCYITDLASRDNRLQALRELETAYVVVYALSQWMYNRPGGLDYFSDNRLSQGGARPLTVQDTPTVVATEAAEERPSRLLLKSLMEQGLGDNRAEVRAAAARALEKLGVATSEALRTRNRSSVILAGKFVHDEAEEIKNDVIAALIHASNVMRVQDPPYSHVLEEQAKQFDKEIIVF